MAADVFAKPPESIRIGGALVPVEFDFRFGIAMERAVQGGDPDVEGLLRRFYLGSVPADVSGAVDAMVAFFSGPDMGGKTGTDEKKGGRVYDFGQDEDVLLASFFAVYGIDLTTVRLHWWTFKRLLLCMPAESPFMQRVGYRTADTRKMPKDLRQHYKKMKRLFAIRDSGERKTRTVEERDAALLERVAKRFENADSELAGKGGNGSG